METAVARILLGSAPLDEASMGTLAVFQWATGRRALTPVTEVSTGPGAPGRAELAEENRAALRQLHDWKLDLGARYFASGAALALAWLLGHIEQP
ncbi:hypothetical protein OHV05_14715 [Kitasatospora sp. NBC_00070]|uniref:hypothetical protein n=1 Tax=Kitasatospora sp. NBC_00070 TaxID=2975962 RepID=UPI00324327EE